MSLSDLDIINQEFYQEGIEQNVNWNILPVGNS